VQESEDAAKLPGQERARLRRQALDWLRAELDGWARLLDKQPDKARPAVTQALRHWQQDPDLAGVRGPKALAKLPEAERPAWQKLWDDIQHTLTKAQGQSPAPEKGKKSP
jgi:hypothetical protein